ncbi:hypothetical protein CABS01_05493 [Colletotrichum abscissum]|nr:hypothetical protein CABS01_05493 [Colletotrichum abscissum]
MDTPTISIDYTTIINYYYLEGYKLS